MSRCAPGFWTPIQREVWTEPSWLSSVIHASLVCTFCPTPRFGTTMTLRTGSYEQLSAEYTEPYTFTFDDIGLNVPSAAGVIGRPKALPTENGWGCCGCWGCCARTVVRPSPTVSAAAPVIDECVSCVRLLQMSKRKEYATSLSALLL